MSALEAPQNLARTNQVERPRVGLQGFWSKLLNFNELPFKVVIYSDFDGTISQTDSLKYILNRRGNPQWHFIEDAMARGIMAERDGLQKCFDFYSQSFETALRDVLKNVRIDPYFSRFHSWCERQGHSLTVLSGGFESLIRPLFDRAGLSGIRVLANDAEVVGKSWTVKSCDVKALCSLCNHCKSASLLETIKQDPKTCIVYIGDGHTDSCPVQLADIVFAKGYLSEYCRKTNIEHYEFADFRDVLRQLRWKLRLLRRHIENRPSLFAPTDAISWPARRFIERARAA